MAEAVAEVVLLQGLPLEVLLLEEEEVAAVAPPPRESSFLPAA